MKMAYGLIDFFKNLNKHEYMIIIWLILLACAIWIICSLIHLPVVWRIGVVFAIFNNIVAYMIGRIVEKRQLSFWWLLLFPIVFAIAVIIHYAQYNYLFCVIYLCLELFGLWHDNFYHEKN
ncbi:hypothetical protein J2Z60_000204 [Lactobacillus colini]|uniref:Integral membrane protein n=1 Tax=Lactobacillus colini TaxID=1819254 RepID=A0ABS4MBI8_9LACO|nr:hypothetical protein [Lactobacillus colini]MBP2057042.1 hypothetical protein [Lactobacillus colini]